MSTRVRLAFMVTVVVIVQAGVLPELRIGGVVPDLGLLVALAVAIRLGPVEGALVGFACGVGTDLFVQTPLGLTALCNSVVAYAAGTLWTGLIHPPRWAAPWAGLLGGLVSGLLFIGIGIIFGVDVLRDWSSVVVVAKAAVYDAFLAIPVFWAVDRALRDAPTAETARW
jgi:rod shape-determining protein MreD